MAVYSKKLHILKGTTQHDIELYTTSAEAGGSPCLHVLDGTTELFAKIGSTTDSNATPLHVLHNNTEYAVWKHAVPKSTILLHFDNANPTQNGVKLAGAGTYSMSSDYKKFGSYGMLLNHGNSGYSYAYIDDVTLGGKDFTIDIWASCTDFKSSAVGDVLNYSGVFAFNAEPYAEGFAKYGVWTSETGTQWVASAVGNGINGFYHYAFVYKHDTSKVYGFINGDPCFEATKTITRQARTLYLATNHDHTQHTYSGVIDELRIIDGYAAWTAKFTPPTAAYTQ